LNEFRELKFIPDWPRTKQLVAKHLRCSEVEVQAMKDSRDSLDQVQLALAIEEVLGIPID
jgi:acyl carrier protein